MANSTTVAGAATQLCWVAAGAGLDRDAPSRRTVPLPPGCTVRGIVSAGWMLVHVAATNSHYPITKS